MSLPWIVYWAEERCGEKNSLPFFILPNSYGEARTGAEGEAGMFY